MGPRANFECRGKGCRLGEAAPPVYELPVTATRCAVCGSKRLRRLYDAVNVSTAGHRVARFVDPQLQPMFDEHASVRAGAQRFTQEAAASLDRAMHRGSPAERAALAEGPGGGLVHRPPNPLGVLNALSPAARQDSAKYLRPAFQRRVLPVAP